jgi:hypothetical protein
MINQPYKIISKVTQKSEFSDQIFDDYELELNDEMYLNFHIKTIGSISIEEGEVLDFNNQFHYFHYIHTDIFNKGVKLEYISGVKNGGYNIKASIIKVKKWLDKNGDKLLLGKGYQHKSS